MKQMLLITGGSGAVGRPLLAALAAVGEVEKIYVLVRHLPDNFELPKVKLVPGDVTNPNNCGLSPETARELAGEVTAILHGAAHTRFDAPLDLARHVNVAGTQNLLTLATRCRRLERFGFLSTCHVAGKRCGKILESELTHACGFVNAYEQTKHEAEQLLRAAYPALPIAVYRLSTILGDAPTGAVNKLAAVHHAIRFFYGSLAPMIPGQADSPVDLISQDYAVAAICELFCHRFAAGQTFHVCAGDDALPLDEFLDLTLKVFMRHRPAWRKRGIEKPAIVDLPTFELFARSVEEIGDSPLVQSVALVKHFAPQLAFPKQFDDTECARALANSGVTRPGLREFYPRVIQWLMEHRWGPRALPEMEGVAA
ncbi:MAG: SDR family oxidoreductase [Verrucomicrobia bacterium]|nr:SDR family oxidoreductase [Verrucomicrobiota bacterium]